MKRGKGLCLTVIAVIFLMIAAPQTVMAEDNNQGLTPQQIAQEAYKDYIIVGYTSQDAFDRVKYNLQPLVAIKHANAQSVQQFVNMDIVNMRNTVVPSMGKTPEQIVQEAYAAYIASGMTSAQAYARVQATLVNLTNGRIN
ncbi:MAG: hypothetical protein KBH85_10450 [Lachnospiraceae bacterium]|nr:hypothetical protein [Lachnospiraceae bacterium]